MHVWNVNNALVDLSDLEGGCVNAVLTSLRRRMTRRSFSFPPETGDEPYVIVPWFWIPQDNLKLRAASDHVPYDCGSNRLPVDH